MCSPTDRIPQGKVVALSGENGEEASLAEPALRAGHEQREGAHDDKHAQFGKEDAQKKGPDDVLEVQQDHVLEQKRWQRELRHEVAQSFGLGAGDYVGPPRDVSAQDDPKTLQQRREELVDGHGAGERRQVAALRGVKVRGLHFYQPWLFRTLNEAIALK